MQLINKSYELDSKNNAFRYLTEYPMRGLIYDRNNVLLVYNRSDVSFYVDLRMIKQKYKNEINANGVFSLAFFYANTY